MFEMSQKVKEVTVRDVDGLQFRMLEENSKDYLLFPCILSNPQFSPYQNLKVLLAERLAECYVRSRNSQNFTSIMIKSHA